MMRVSAVGRYTEYYNATRDKQATIFQGAPESHVTSGRSTPLGKRVPCVRIPCIDTNLIPMWTRSAGLSPPLNPCSYIDISYSHLLVYCRKVGRISCAHPSESTAMPDDDDDSDGQPTHVLGGGASATVVLGDKLIINASGGDFEDVANYVSQEARYWMERSDYVLIKEGDEIHQHVHHDRGD